MRASLNGSQTSTQSQAACSVSMAWPHLHRPRPGSIIEQGAGVHRPLLCFCYIICWRNAPVLLFSKITHILKQPA
jgi:hypothetical protein